MNSIKLKRYTSTFVFYSKFTIVFKDNVQALMDSTSKAQLVLPAVFKAIEDISKLSEIYETYTNDLRVTGMEIQQIEFLNRGLETQTRNLENLNEEVQKIIVRLTICVSICNVCYCSLWWRYRTESWNAYNLSL